MKQIDNLFVEKLFSFKKHCDKNNCCISLCGGDQEILAIFYLIKLDKYFEFYENIEEAVSRQNRLIRRRLKVV